MNKKKVSGTAGLVMWVIATPLMLYYLYNANLDFAGYGFAAGVTSATMFWTSVHELRSYYKDKNSTH